MIDTFVTLRGLYESMNICDIANLFELPYPIFHDVLMKQIEENKAQKEAIEKAKSGQLNVKSKTRKSKR